MSHYIDQNELKTELIAARESGHVSDRLGEMFSLLADRAMKTWKFKHIDHEDAKQDAFICLMRCVEVADLNRSPQSLFSYLTTCVLNQFKQNYRHQLRHLDLAVKFWERKTGERLEG